MSPLDAKEAVAPAARDEALACAKSNPLMAVLRLLCVAAWTSACYTGYTTRRFLLADAVAKRQASVRWSRRWFRGLLQIAGIRAHAVGQAPRAPVLITPNHLGYLDIVAVGALCDTMFVSKAEVESWPIIGFLFKQAEGIGVTRGRLRGVHEANRIITERLEQGLSVCVFLEGTSSGGGAVMPFHSSLIQPAIDAGVPVVPAAVRWRATDPAIDIAEDVAYWGGHSLVPHLWRVLGLRGLRVDVTFGDPFLSGGQDRKALAKTAHDRVSALLEDR
ncbi:MAG: 1-acyl-sn-glycerol-3-phosphate acyltransferase [Candidatus Hydrogenedentes bacterium]|nr:1-acyl-sn-glycerol-3-phosphate acyltransferase [Candidatus Hydrogenedentota bacterium]